MSEPIALFGLKLTPGEVYRMDVFRDFKITNVAFGETVKGSGRSVVKVHVTPSYGHPMTEDDMDSDEEEEEDDEDDEEKEEARALKVYEERSFVLAALTPGKVSSVDDAVAAADHVKQSISLTPSSYSLRLHQIEQVAVNLQFTEDEEIGFSVTGDNEVDLLGNYIAPFDDEPSDSELYDSDDDSVIYSDDYDDEDEYDSDEMAADGLDAILAGEDSEDDEDDEEIGSPQIEELELEVAPPAAAASKKRKAATETATADVSMASSVGGAVTDSELAKAAAAEGLDVSNLSKAQRKRLNKKLKSASGDAVDADVSVASSSAIPAAAAAKVEKPKAEVKKEVSDSRR